MPYAGYWCQISWYQKCIGVKFTVTFFNLVSKFTWENIYVSKSWCEIFWCHKIVKYSLLGKKSSILLSKISGVKCPGVKVLGGFD